MKISQSKILSIIDKHSIGIRNVQSAFNNGCRDQHIKFTINKTQHQLFEFFSVHLTMSHSNSGIRNQSLNHSCYFFYIFNSVMNKKYLPPSLDFISNSISDIFIIITNHMRSEEHTSEF